MKREKIKSYEEIKGSLKDMITMRIERLSLKIRSATKIEDCLHAMKEAGDTPGKRDMENYVDSILSDSYEAYPVECSLSYISPRLLKRFTVVYDINSCEIKEVSAKIL